MFSLSKFFDWIKDNTLSKLFFSIAMGSILFSACRKDILSPQYETAKPCVAQIENPAGRSYSSDSVVDFTCAEKHCGMLPLSSKNYWIYEDSVFNNGVFVRVQFDTLRFNSNKVSLEDGLVWWTSNINVGLPATLYTNDSAFFNISDRLFMPGVKDVRKDYSLFPGDSIKYLANFDDNAANGRSIRLKAPVATPAGTFDNCIYFEKNARNFRRDQVYFKPGLGVLKYIHEKAPMGSPIVKMQQILTLVAIHFE